MGMEVLPDAAFLFPHRDCNLLFFLYTDSVRHGVSCLYKSFNLFSFMNKKLNLIIAILSLVGAVLVLWNQYWNGPIGGDLALWNYIDPFVIVVMLLASISLWKSSQ